MNKVIERYNKLMQELGYEYVTIGTELSDYTEFWNLRDMVAEADYWLSTFNEVGHENHMLKYDNRKVWRQYVGKLQRFINRFKTEAMQMECTTRHCSRFD